MKPTRIKQHLLTALSFFIFLIIERQIGTRFPMPTSFVANFIQFYLFIIVYCRLKKPEKLSVLYRNYLFGCVLPNIIISCFEGFMDSLIFYPVILFELLSIYLGWQFYKSRKLLPALIAAGVLTFITNYWGDEWRHVNAFGNMYGKTTEVVPTNWAVYNEHGDTLSFNSYKDKIVVFDFWNTGCPPCVKKFPEFQKLYAKYGNDTRVVLQAVHIPIASDSTETAFNRIRKRGYNFPVVVNAKNAKAAFNIHLFPTLIIFRNDHIIFRGDISNVGSLIDDELKRL